jgi:hypothetical protein
LTLNYQGLANPSKKSPLKRLIENIKPYIIPLQELISNSEKITRELSKMFSIWDLNFTEANAIGRSRGNLTRCKKCSFTLTNSWYFPTRLGTSHFSLDMGKDITIMNVCGPYMDRVEQWDNFFNMECIQNGLVVVGGDLNFTLGDS